MIGLVAVLIALLVGSFLASLGVRIRVVETMRTVRGKGHSVDALFVIAAFIAMVHGNDSNKLQGQGLRSTPPPIVFSTTEQTTRYAKPVVRERKDSAPTLPATAEEHRRIRNAGAHDFGFLKKNAVPDAGLGSNVWIETSGVLRFGEDAGISVFENPLGFTPEWSGEVEHPSRLAWMREPGRFSVLWENALVERRTNSVVTFRADLYDNGDILAQYHSDMPWTNGLVRLWNGGATQTIDTAELPTNAVSILWRNIAKLGNGSGDADGDGLSDFIEVRRGTNPDKADTDGDGLADGAEASAGCDPLDPDTDGDGMADGWDAEPATASTAAFGQSAAWLAAAGIAGTTNALEWAQGVVNGNADAYFLARITVSGVGECRSALVAGDGFPSVVLTEDATLWYPLPIAEDVEFRIIGDELEISASEAPPRLLFSPMPVDENGVFVLDRWYGEARLLVYKPPRVSIGKISDSAQSSWLTFRASVMPERIGTYEWRVTPDDVAFVTQEDTLSLWWHNESGSEYAEITAIWSDGPHDASETIRVERPSFEFSGTDEPLRIRLISVTSDKGGVSANPPPFLGETTYTFNPSQTVPDKHFVVFYKDVIDSSFTVQPYVIHLVPELNREPAPWEEVNVQWTKISGPTSGSFSSTSTLETTYDTPSEGGVYRFGVTLNNRPRSECVVVLPLAGASVDTRLVSDMGSADIFAAVAKAKYSKAKRNSVFFGLQHFYAFGNGDYRGRPDADEIGKKTVWTYNGVNEDTGMGGVTTLCGRPIRVAKLSNFLAAYACALIEVSEDRQSLSQGLGHGNDESASETWNAGRLVANGQDFAQTMTGIVNRTWWMADEKVQRLWPNPEPVRNYVLPIDYFDPDTQFTTPGFLYYSY